MLKYNLAEYGDNYAKTLVILGQYYEDESSHNMTDPRSFEFKSRFLNNTDNTGTVNVEIAAPLRYLSKFWRNCV